MKCIVVTPYFMEDAATLYRVHMSVIRQTVPTDHLFVSDGGRLAPYAFSYCRTLALDRSHGDYGNTPRGLGALLAVSEGYQVVMTVDADNWLEPNHVELALATAEKAGNPDYVVASRIYRRPDGSVLPVEVDDDTDSLGHVDTSCFVMFPGAHAVLAHWALQPRELSIIGDRVFNNAVRQAGLVGAFIDEPTVNYTCRWESFYRQGPRPPESELKPLIDPTPSADWVKGLSNRDLRIAERRAGVRLSRSKPPWERL